MNSTTNCDVRSASCSIITCEPTIRRYFLEGLLTLGERNAPLHCRGSIRRQDRQQHSDDGQPEALWATGG